MQLNIAITLRRHSVMCIYFLSLLFGGNTLYISRAKHIDTLFRAKSHIDMETSGIDNFSYRQTYLITFLKSKTVMIITLTMQMYVN